MLVESRQGAEGRSQDMNPRARKEKRLHPRIPQKLPVKIVANGYDFATVTKNISCVGAYCQIPKYVPPFTRIAVHIDLPILNKGATRDCHVECKGVIVRTEDEKEGGFNIAVFFNEIKDNQRRKISQYINQFLSRI